MAAALRKGRLSMKTFYCVVSKFYDNGSVKAFVFSVQAEEKPKDEELQKRLYDEYHNYFDTYAEAERYRKECYMA